MWKTMPLLTAAAWAIAVATGHARTWTDSTGQHQVEAEYVASQADKLWLRRVSDDEVFELRLAELCQADREHVLQLQRDEEAQRQTRRPDEAGRIRYGPPRQLAKLANRAVDESSGLACSRRRPGLFWTHNDSGSAAQIHLFDAKGRDLGSSMLAGGIRAWDWEDMASFTWQGKHYLLLGDVGNNGLAAPVQMLHLVEEPPIDPERGVLARRIPIVRTIPYSYEDDHRDCEAVAVDPADRTILLATKQFELASYVYAIDWPDNEPKKALVARRIATLKIPLVTAMDVSPDGRRAVVATYGNAYEFLRKENEPWAAAFSREPREIRLPLRIQGEAICYGPDGRTLYLTSEKLPTPFWEVPVAEGP
jgi:hypothetical protein